MGGSLAPLRWHRGDWGEANNTPNGITGSKVQKAAAPVARDRRCCKGSSKLGSLMRGCFQTEEAGGSCRVGLTHLRSAKNKGTKLVRKVRPRNKTQLCFS